MTSPRISKPTGGFSLLEMLLVLILAAILVALGSAGYSGAMQAAAITTGADMISDVFAEARTSAVAQNVIVEVRIYELTPQSGGAPAYNALQLHVLKSDGTSPPLSNVRFLSPWAAIDATANHSSLIGANSQVAKPDATDTRLDSHTKIFHFLPDGTTDLSPATSWFLTVRAATQSDPSHFPSNWACVKVDATTGRPQIYRP
jgi:uncharacterized protein (TIGR02596 family)